MPAVLDKVLGQYEKIQVCPIEDCNATLVKANTQKERAYVCPVPNCTASISNSRKTLARHLQDETQHTATELLDSGVEVWYRRKASAQAAEETYHWLKRNNYIRDKKRKRDTKAEEKEVMKI